MSMRGIMVEGGARAASLQVALWLATGTLAVGSKAYLKVYQQRYPGHNSCLERVTSQW